MCVCLCVCGGESATLFLISLCVCSLLLTVQICCMFCLCPYEVYFLNFISSLFEFSLCSITVHKCHVENLNVKVLLNYEVRLHSCQGEVLVTQPDKVSYRCSIVSSILAHSLNPPPPHQIAAVVIFTLPRLLVIARKVKSEHISGSQECQTMLTVVLHAGFCSWLELTDEFHWFKS